MKSLRYVNSILLLVALAAAAATTVAGARDVPFAARVTIQSGLAKSHGAALADIDGDGDLDMVGAAFVEDVVIWSENTNGDGSAWTPHTIAGYFESAWRVAVGDIDGDGDVDVVATSGNGAGVAWWENQDGVGGSWFYRNITGPTTNAQYAVVTDFDGDGDNDVVYSEQGLGYIRFLENTDGAGTTWASLDSDHQTAMYDVQGMDVADVDGDGRLDIIAGSRNGDVLRWYSWDPSGSPVWTAHTVATGFDEPKEIVACDIDRDGDMDFAVAAHSGSHVSWFENTSSDGSTWRENVVDASMSDPYPLDVVDLDKDGDQDIVLATRNSDLVVWYENRTDAGSGWARRTIDSSFPGGSRVIAGDIDNDGDPDILGVASNSNIFAWWENLTVHHNAVFPKIDVVTNTADSARCVMPGDIDGDGDFDLVSASYNDGVIAWYENQDGKGSFGPINTVSNSAGQAHQARLFDIDNDGDLDILASWQSGSRVAWFENTDGAGAFGVPNIISTSSSFPFWVDAADLDADGDLDVMVAAAGADAEFEWYRNNGSGVFTFAGYIDEHRDEADSIVAADIDGDGDLDVVTGSGIDDTVAWHENLGGTGTSWGDHTITTSADRVMAVAVGDIDGDGDIDVLSSGDGDGLVGWYRNTDGQGTFTSRIVLGNAGGTRVITVDLDGDGDLDVMTGGGSPAVGWFENLDGAGTFSPLQTINDSLGRGRWIAAADIDSDGLVDVIAASWPDNTIAWMRNRGGQFVTDTTDTAPALLEDSATTTVLQIVARHNGRVGDPAIDIRSFEFLFEESPGDPLTEAEANALIDRVDISVDTGGSFLTPAGGVTTLAWNASGNLTFSLIARPWFNYDYATSRTFFLSVALTPNASDQAVHQFRITHITDPDAGAPIATANDSHGIPLFMQYTPNVSSGIITATKQIPIAPVLLAEPPFTSGTENTVYWNPSDVGTSYQIQCATDSAFSSLVDNVFVASPTLEYTFGPLNDGTLYYYRALTWNTSDASSPWSNIVSSRQDATSPTHTVEINGGDTYVNQLAVTLNLTYLDPNPSGSLDPNASASGVSDMRFRNQSAATWGEWITAAPTAAWTLYDLDGVRTVLAQFRDNAGNVSDASVFDTIILDRVRPSVTVEQAAGQPDPTDALPIFFDVVFSEPVTGFTTGDVTMGGSAGSVATWTVLPVTASSYRIRIDTVTLSGTLIPSIPAGVATDAAGNPNYASTSVDNTVIYFTDVQLVSPTPLGGGLFGFSLTGTGDLNDDDHGDVVVGAYFENSGGSTPVEHVGRVHVYDGDENVCVLLYSIDSPKQQAFGAFGYAVARMDDVDGDSVDEIIVGAHRQDAFLKSESGVVYVFSGASGKTLATLTSPNDQSFGYFGFSVAGVPNVYDSGLPGIAVGAPGESTDESPSHAGRTYLFSTSDGTTWNAVTIMSSSEQTNGYFGYSVSGVAAIDGNGGGVIIGASGENVAYQFLPGSVAAPSARGSGKPTGGRLLPVDAAAFGCAVAGVPDADGDGSGDVIIGARAAYDTGGPIYSGRAYLYNGKTRTLLHTFKSPNEEAYGHFGHAVAGIDDTNGNGRGDVLVGAMSETVAGNGFSGRVYVFDGGTGEHIYTFTSPDSQYDGRYGCAVSGIPEPTPDGLRDVVVGAYNEDAIGYAYIQALPAAASPWLTRTRNWELYR